jgi:hypothetical protein
MSEFCEVALVAKPTIIAAARTIDLTFPLTWMKTLLG